MNRKLIFKLYYVTSKVQNYFDHKIFVNYHLSNLMKVSQHDEKNVYTVLKYNLEINLESSNEVETKKQFH